VEICLRINPGKAIINIAQRPNQLGPEKNFKIDDLLKVESKLNEYMIMDLQLFCFCQIKEHKEKGNSGYNPSYLGGRDQ
jgi:hypothetical protein